MTRTFLAALVATTSLLVSPVLADSLQVNVTYGGKAEKAIEKTYGERERATLGNMLTRNLTRELGTQAARVEVVVNDVVPNRPTFKQLGDRPGLSFQSYGIGGADISGKAYDRAGNLLGQVNYDWYGDILWANTAWTWSDADRAMYQFSRRLAAAVRG